MSKRKSLINPTNNPLTREVVTVTNPYKPSEDHKQASTPLVQLNVLVPNDRRTAMKLLAAETNRDMRDLVDEAISLLLKAHGRL